VAVGLADPVVEVVPTSIPAPALIKITSGSGSMVSGFANNKVSISADDMALAMTSAFPVGFNGVLKFSGEVVSIVVGPVAFISTLSSVGPMGSKVNVPVSATVPAGEANVAVASDNT
jgi:hypothetical protein